MIYETVQPPPSAKYTCHFPHIHYAPCHVTVILYWPEGARGDLETNFSQWPLFLEASRVPCDLARVKTLIGSQSASQSVTERTRPDSAQWMTWL